MQLIEQLKDLAIRNVTSDQVLIAAARDAKVLDRGETTELVDEVCVAMSTGDFSRLTFQNPGMETRITYVNQKNQMATLAFAKPN